MPPSPRVPRTTTSASTSAATARIARATPLWPLAIRGSATSPAAVARCAPSAAVSSAFCWPMAAISGSSSYVPPKPRPALVGSLWAIASTNGFQTVSTVAGAPGISRAAWSMAACASADPSKDTRIIAFVSSWWLGTVSVAVQGRRAIRRNGDGPPGDYRAPARFRRTIRNNH